MPARWGSRAAAAELAERSISCVRATNQKKKKTGKKKDKLVILGQARPLVVSRWWLLVARSEGPLRGAAGMQR